MMKLEGREDDHTHYIFRYDVRRAKQIASDDSYRLTILKLFITS